MKIKDGKLICAEKRLSDTIVYAKEQLSRIAETLRHYANRIETGNPFDMPSIINSIENCLRNVNIGTLARIGMELQRHQTEIDTRDELTK